MHIQGPPGRGSFNQWSRVAPQHTHLTVLSILTRAVGGLQDSPIRLPPGSPRVLTLLGAVGLEWSLEEGQTSGEECQVQLWTHQVRGACGGVPGEDLGAAGPMLLGTGEHLL